MKLSKILRLSFNMLLHSRLRSWLTILGIFIGIAAVVAIISIGQGLQQSVNSQISGLGQDVISVNAGSSRAFGEGRSATATTNVNPLSERDIQALKLVPGIKYINGIVSGRAKVRYRSQNATLSVQGSDVSIFKEFVTNTLDSGRYLLHGEIRSVVVGNSVANKVFSSQLETGYLLMINNKPFRIVGILSSSSGFGGSDNVVYMSERDAREILSNTTDIKQNEFSSINIKVINPDTINETTNRISEALSNSHHLAPGKEDFSVNSAQALQQRFSSITASVTLFLGLLAAISLLVGGIGVANTMFTSVLEKTKDIGVMKAIGARNSNILLIFLFNSGMLGLVGGILGIVGGSAISLILPYLGIDIGLGGGRGGGVLHTLVSPSLLIFSLLFSLAIGMLSGAIPAYRASKLKPVDALRYE